MANILFLYNDLNNVKGISTVMQVAERYAMKSGHGKFLVTSSPKPAINFEDGSSIAIRPVTQGLSNLNDFDEIYVDDSLHTIIDTNENFNHNNVSLYNETSFS